MNKIQTFISLFFLLLLVSYQAYSQGTLKGFVKEQSNGETIPYANVIIEKIRTGDVTDENGYYVIPNIPVGKYTVMAQMIGYKTKEQEVNIDNSTTTIDFYLEMTMLEMDAVIKTAECV